MCILKGFPTALKSATSFPFGLWFANSRHAVRGGRGQRRQHLLHGTGTYTAAAGADHGRAAEVGASTNGTWTLAYTLADGLNLGAPYTVPGYPTGDNPATGLPWAPATDGLRNITGQVNRNGTVTIWGVTSTVSGGGDQGADPNKLVVITDNPGAQTLPAESFATFESARSGEVLRGVSFTPGTPEGGR